VVVGLFSVWIRGWIRGWQVLLKKVVRFSLTVSTDQNYCLHCMRTLETRCQAKKCRALLHDLQASSKHAPRSRKHAALISLPSMVNLFIRIISEQKLLENRVRPPVREAFEWLMLDQLAISFFLSVAIVHVEYVPEIRTSLDDARGPWFTQGLVDQE